MKSVRWWFVMAVVLVASASLASTNPPKVENGKWNSFHEPILGLTFPTQAEASEHSVKATPVERAEAMKWIREVMSPDALLKDLETHLLPLTGFICTVEPFLVSEQARADRISMEGGHLPLDDGFAVDYELPGYGLRIMETRTEVVVAIRPLANDKPREDLQTFEQEIAGKFLKVKPMDPPVTICSRQGKVFTWWSPRKSEAIPHGRKIMHDPAIPVSSIYSVTNGANVVFRANKSISFQEQLVPRFEASPTKPQHSEPPASSGE